MSAVVVVMVVVVNVEGSGKEQRGESKEPWAPNSV